MPTQLVMRRTSLGGLPPVSSPEGVGLRPSRPDAADAAAWEAVLTASFGTVFPPGSFDRVMREDPAYHPGRVLLAEERGRVVGTASAWHRPAYGEAVGYLHYVAVRPEATGRRIGRQLSLACLHLMADQGRTSAVLQTDDHRLPAIRTYLGLGFKPFLVEDAQRPRWEAVAAALGLDPGALRED